MTQADELLTPKETAAFLKVHERTVRRWIKNGKVPCVRIGGTVRVARRDLLAAMTSGAAGPELALPEGQRRALDDVKLRLLQCGVPIDQLILFGSAARGEAGTESDIDLLVVTAKPVSRRQRHEITDLVFDVNLARGTNISTVVVDSESWLRGALSAMPIRAEVEAEGVVL